MKFTKLILIFLFVIVTSSITIYGNTTCPEIVNDNGIVTVKGEIFSHLRDENISIQVIYPGYTLDDITEQNYNDVVLYSYQQKTGIGGKYEFAFQLGGKLGEYKIYLCDNVEKKVEEFKIEHFEYVTIDFELNSFGNIYFNLEDINADVSIHGTEDASVILNIDICSMENDDIIKSYEYTETLDKYGRLAKTISFNIEDIDKPYGFFKIKYSVKDVNENIYKSGETRFSMVNKSEEMNNKMGINGIAANYTAEQHKEIAKLSANAGYSYLRVNAINWAHFEKEKENYAMMPYMTDFFNYSSMYNVTPYVILGYSNKLYQETIEGEEILTPRSTAYLEAWGNYCYEAANIIKNYSHDYEIWNEYNLMGSKINPDMGTPQDYVNMMKIAYEKIHLADPQAVVHGIVAGYVTDQYPMSAFEWIDEVMKHDGGKYMDAMSFHVYAEQSKERTPEGRNKVKIISDVKDILGKYGYADIPFVVSETGYSSSNFTEEEQAAYELRDYALMYDSVDKLFWYTINDKDDEREYEHALGHIRMLNQSDLYPTDILGEAKPVYLALSNLNALLANSDLVEKNVNGSVYDYVFCTVDGKRVHMIWNADDEPEVININDNLGFAKLYDMYGNKTHVNMNELGYTVAITGNPVYLVKDEVVEISFKNNESGSVIGSITSDKIVVEGELSKLTDVSNNDVQVIIAGYGDNDELVILSTIRLNTLENSFNETIDTSELNVVKVFVWDGFDSLVPLQKAKIIKK